MRKELRIFVSTFLAISMLLSLSISSSAESTNPTRTITDMAGREVTIDGSIDNIFVDWASGVTLVMTLGATDRLVAVPSAFHSDTFAWCQIICPQLNSIPDDDAAYQNVESVLKYEPQLVITSTKESVEQYELMGLNVIYVRFTDDASFQESIRIVGAALGDETSQRATEYCEYMNSNIALAQERTRAIPDNEKPSVYYMDSRFTDAYHTVGSGEIQEGWITYAGGKLATADQFQGRNIEITAEQFLNIDPDIILIGAQNQAMVKDLLLADPVLAELTAIKTGNIVRIPQGMFPWCRTGPEAAMQSLWAGKLLHPELFTDVEIIEVAREFYQRFYGATLTDEQLNGILSGKLTPDAE